MEEEQTPLEPPHRDEPPGEAEPPGAGAPEVEDQPLGAPGEAAPAQDGPQPGFQRDAPNAG